MILSTVLSLGLLAQVALPGDNLSVDAALAKSRTVVVATPWNSMCVGGATWMTGSFGLMHIEVLKGETKDPLNLLVNIYSSGKESMPDQRKKYVFFLVEGPVNHQVIHPETPTAIKVVAYSPEIVAKLKGNLKKNSP